ncbi:hypothetical protein J4226_02330 [Candidatus Pacearchaeota archaeon]|nr:hypothetical protein [Candidatus Pacearchaeota archaeon]
MRLPIRPTSPVHLATKDEYLEIMAILKSGRCRWEDGTKPLSERSKVLWDAYEENGLTIAIIPAKVKGVEQQQHIKLIKEKKGTKTLSYEDWLEIQKFGPKTIAHVTKLYRVSVAA